MSDTIPSSTSSPSSPSSSSPRPPPPPPPSSSTSTSSSLTLRSPLWNALHLSISFCLIFLAFSVAQNSQTSLDAEVGAIGLGILYGVFTLSNTFSSWIVDIGGVKLALVGGGLTYALYVGANIYTITVLLYISSAVIGFGAAVLWTAEGGYIAGCSQAHERKNHLPNHSTLGWFNGIFFSIFQVNQFVGNLLAALLYQQHVGKATVFSVMTVICGLGVATLLPLAAKPQAVPQAELVPTEEEEAVVARVDGDSVTTGDYREEESAADAYTDGASASKPITSARRYKLLSMLDSLLLLKDLRMLLLVPIIIYSGFSQSWIYGVFPPFILEPNIKFYVLAFFGAIDAIASYAMGKLSDIIGRMPVLLIGTLAHGFMYLYVLTMAPEMETDTDTGKQYLPVPMYYYFLMALALGIGDGVFNTQIYAILGTFYQKQPEKAFANLKLFQAGSTAGLFGYSSTTNSLIHRTQFPFFALAGGMVCAVICSFLHPFTGAKEEETKGAVVSDTEEAAILNDTEPSDATPNRTIGTINRSKHVARHTE